MEYGYGKWWLVGVSVILTLYFVKSVFKPRTKTDWTTYRTFGAFIVALFTEMYGFPLTIYFLSGWLTKRFPGMDIYSHDMGHLLENFFGWGGDPHFGPFHIVSIILIFGGFVLLSNAWRILHAAQREHILATTGPYAKMRHPQYVAFVIIMFGFLLQWPTILTLIMFPILVWMYVRLAKSEEKEAEKEFGEAWDIYARNTSAFLPSLQSKIVEANPLN